MVQPAAANPHRFIHRILLGFKRRYRRSAAIVLGGVEAKPRTYSDSSQTVMNNFVCGLLLLFERPIKVSDMIQIDADVGEVRRIGIRACVIRTMEGS